MADLSSNIILVIAVTSIATYLSRCLGVFSSEKIDENSKIFRLFDGKVINKEKEKINNFQFDQIDFSLSEFTSSTILVPKIQEVPSKDLFKCSLKLFKSSKETKFKYFNCNEKIKDTINQELLKRFYKPLFLPVIAVTCCFLIIIPRNSIRYSKNRKSGFIFS